MFKYFVRLVFFAICSFYCQKTIAFDNTDLAKKGIADLRNINLHEKPVALNGEWAFAWKKLLFPADTSPINTYFQFPKLWNGSTVNGLQLSARGYATYGLTVLLPKNTAPLALSLPEFYSSYLLYVNGKIFANNGVPGISMENYSPHWISKTLALPGNTDTLQLILQVANFSHAKGGAKKSILIGDNVLLQSDR